MIYEQPGNTHFSLEIISVQERYTCFPVDEVHFISYYTCYEVLL